MTFQHTSFLLLVFVFLFTAGSAQVTLRGKILNYDGKSFVSYSAPVEGIVPVFGRTGRRLQPRPNGNFEIRFANEGMATMKLHFQGLSYAFFINGKTDIDLVIDQEKISFPEGKKGDHISHSVKQLATISIGGDFAEVNRYYNKTIRSSSLTVTVNGTYLSSIVEKLQSQSEVISFIDSLSQLELAQITALDARLPSEKLPGSLAKDDVKRYLKNQVYVYYGSIFLSGMMLKRFDQGRRLIADPHAQLTVYNPDWERLMEDFFRQTKGKIMPAASSFEYNEFIFNMAYAQDYYKRYDFDQVPLDNDIQIINKLLKPRLQLLDSLSLLDEKTVLAYKLQNLSYLISTQTFYSSMLLRAVNELKRIYPDSKHLLHYDEEVKKLKLYLETSAVKFDKAKIIETNYVEFEDLIASFKGKNVFIDVWATWCGPCVEDFSYKSIFKPYIESGELTMLYVSIDKPVWRKKWEENMRFNQLEGFHVLADNVLIHDMWNFLGGIPGMIPRYALVDRSGQLFLPSAPRLSERDALIQQIELLLNKP